VQLLSTQQSTLEKQLDALEADRESAESDIADLKATLKVKFGSTINLER
jgi:chaperonin cofactor prefoldin